MILTTETVNKMTSYKRALVVVDVQQDFCEGGSLAVTGGIALGYKIADTMREHGRGVFGLYQYIILTKDFHLPGSNNGGHFSEAPDYTSTWPEHCVQGTSGAMLHPAVSEASWEYSDAIFYKGQGRPDYSGFQGKTPGMYEDIHMLDWLNARQIKSLDIVGIATDYCVKATAMDAVENGFEVRIPETLTVAVGGAVARRKSIEDVYAAQGLETAIN